MMEVGESDYGPHRASSSMSCVCRRTTTNMAARGQDRTLISVQKSKPVVLNLSNKGITEVPHIIGNIPSIKSLILKNNALSDLPAEIAALVKLENINLGNNSFQRLPSIFQHTNTIKKLHLFNNNIEILDSFVLCGGLKNLTLLNLNNNKLGELPPEINRLSYLKILSLDNNRIIELPCEICHLSELEELHVNANYLQSLPDDIAFLRKLKKLNVRKNAITVVPEGLWQCCKLQVLDVAGNSINTFPAEILKLSSMKEFYCEENNMLQHLPVHSVQEEEVLTLKEISGRLISAALNDSKSDIRMKIKHYPEVQALLKFSSRCVVCDGPYINTWLECVRFVDSKKFLGTRNNAGIIPVRGLLCSYKCLNRGDYFGIAQVVG